jgi:aryl-alcohol dehydrogenase-like predicted oxidoreductase
MRYRSFGDGGQSISTVLVSVDSQESATISDAFLSGCLALGVNAFEARLDDLTAIQALGRTLSSVERSMVVVGLRTPASESRFSRDLTRETIIRQLQDALRNTGLRWIDYLIVDDPQQGELGPSFFMTVEAARQAKRLRYVGVSGDNVTISDVIESGGVQIYAAPYNLRCSQIVRKRMRQAEAASVMILGYDHYPEAIRKTQSAPAAAASGILRFLGLGGARRELANDEGPYSFLNYVRNWTAEQICLSYSLNEPSLSAARIQASDLETIKGLVEAAERELPNGLAAQIELARVSDLD